jgi:carbamoyl-phosphate synthase small subunit
MPPKQATLVLEDGTVFKGHHFGAEGETTGEVVFNTAMAGYQEVLTDPSYYGQLVCMTYPLIGNYGVNPDDIESDTPKVRAFIVKENSNITSSWRASESLNNYLKRSGIIGLAGIDTRALVLHIRSEGAMRAVLSTTSNDITQLTRVARESQPMEGADLTKYVTCETVKKLSPLPQSKNDVSVKPYHIVAYDFGIKSNILNCFREAGFELTVVPATTKFEELDQYKPDGVFLSNGPGDPAAVDYAIEEVRKIISRYPTFGICLGHQIMGLALGGKTFKLKFGHRGANHPVRNEKTQIVEITSQNHGFAVDDKSLDPDEVTITHWNLNDHTVSGLESKRYPCFSVQFHPEASPGPHDSHYLFQDFRRLIDEQSARS